MTHAVLKKTALNFVIILALIWTGVFLSQKIVLTTADLGRHIKNGEILSQALMGQERFAAQSLLKTNFYSFTHPDFPVVNHHWGSGLIFYWTHHFFGFEGLGILQLIVLLVAWALMVRLSVRMGGWGWTAVWFLWLVPVFCSRREIRPEIFSVLFTAIFIALFEARKRSR